MRDTSRRDLCKTVAGVATIGMTALAGCMGGGSSGGSEIEFNIENNVEDVLEVGATTVENETRNGTEVVAVTAVIENVSDEDEIARYTYTFYDGETVVDEFSTAAGTNVAAGQEAEATGVIAGRVSEISRIDMSFNLIG